MKKKFYFILLATFFFLFLSNYSEASFKEKLIRIKDSISIPVFNEFNAHGNNKNEKFSEIKIFASIFRKKL